MYKLYEKEDSLANVTENMIVSDDVQKYIDQFGLNHISECQKVLFDILKPEGSYLASIGEAEGKVLAYGLPLLKSIDPTKQETQAIIFAQDRQEVVKIFYILKVYARALGIDLLIINTGISISDQIVRLRRKSHVVISTPIRLLEHIEIGTCDTSHIKNVVIDKTSSNGMESDYEKIDKCLSLFKNNFDCINLWTLCSKKTIVSFQELMDKYGKQCLSIALQEDISCSNNIRYFYAIANNINKIDVLTMVIEGLLIDSKIAVIAKNRIQGDFIEKILQSQGFNAVLMMQENSDSNIILTGNEIIITTIDTINVLEKYNCTHVVSFFASESLKECQAKASYSKSNAMGPVLIELTTKSDNIFVSSLKQNTNIVVQKFIFPSTYESKFIKMLRLNDYLTSICQNNNGLNSIAGDNELLHKDTFDEYSVEDLKKILLCFLKEKIEGTTQAFVGMVEKPSFMVNNDRSTTFKVIFYGPRINDYSKEEILTYCLANKKITLNSITKTLIVDNRIIFYIKDIDKEIILDYIANNPLDGVFVSIENVFLTNNFNHNNDKKNYYNNNAANANYGNNNGFANNYSNNNNNLNNNNNYQQPFMSQPNKYYNRQGYNNSGYQNNKLSGSFNNNDHGINNVNSQQPQSMNNGFGRPQVNSTFNNNPNNQMNGFGSSKQPYYGNNKNAFNNRAQYNPYEVKAPVPLNQGGYIRYNKGGNFVKNNEQKNHAGYNNRPAGSFGSGFVVNGEEDIDFENKNMKNINDQQQNQVKDKNTNKKSGFDFF